MYNCFSVDLFGYVWDQWVLVFQFCLNNSLYLLWSFSLVLVLNSFSFRVRYYLCDNSFCVNIDFAAICWLLLEPFLVCTSNRFRWQCMLSLFGGFRLSWLVFSAIMYYFLVDVILGKLFIYLIGSYKNGLSRFHF